MKPLARFFSRPALYVAWLLLVAATLGVAALGDPYLFGLTVFLLAMLSGLVGAAGLAVVLFSQSVSRRAKGWILAALALTASALGGALHYLGTFQWA